MRKATYTEFKFLKAQYRNKKILYIVGWSLRNQVNHCLLVGKTDGSLVEMVKGDSVFSSADISNSNSYTLKAEKKPVINEGEHMIFLSRKFSFAASFSPTF